MILYHTYIIYNLYNLKDFMYILTCFLLNLE
jgi:hypothetical protein